jgi:hypothetical protein
MTKIMAVTTKARQLAINNLLRWESVRPVPDDVLGCVLKGVPPETFLEFSSA